MHDFRADLAALEVPVDGALVVWSPTLHYGLACALSSAAEVARVDRLVRVEDRARSLTAGSLLRQVVGAALGRDPRDVVVSHTSHGRPVVATRSTDGRRVEVSVTHAGAVVGVACALEGRVGLDVERRESFAGGRAAAVLAAASTTTSELTWVRAQQHPVAAVGRLWVRKEAVLKATGLGLSIDPRTLVLDHAENRVVEWPCREAVGSAAILDVDPGPAYLGAFALLRPIEEVSSAATPCWPAAVVHVVRLPGLP